MLLSCAPASRRGPVWWLVAVATFVCSIPAKAQSPGPEQTPLGKHLLEATVNGESANRDKMLPYPTCAFPGGLCGAVSRDGRIVVAPQFDWVDDFVEERALVRLRGLYGFVDTTGRMIVEPKFELASRFQRGYARVVRRCMRLTDEEQAILAGGAGRARQWAIRHQIAVGQFFDAPDFVPVGQAHIMADTESLGEVGVSWLEELAALPEAERRVCVPTITDPRGLDFGSYKRLKQTDAMAAIEARAIAAFEALGVLMTNTCINYQTILPPVRGEHLALGDTGVVIYSNSVQGARSNFEGGPSALAAGLTGRTPRYGYHLDAHRAGSRHFELRHRPRDLADWGALGGIVGKATNSYWEVPVLSGLDAPPNSDELKHFGAALASFGSVALFHMAGVTPEAPTLADAFVGRRVPQAVPVGPGDFEGFYATYAAAGDKVDVVVFGAPQLSLIEMQRLAALLDGRHVHSDTSLIVATSPEIKFAADRMRLTERIEAAGGIVASGVCFYQSYAREMAEANGWQRLLTNSAKLVNIIGGYGYKPTLASMENCIDSAVAGKIV